MGKEIYPCNLGTVGFKTSCHSWKLKRDKMRKPIVTHFYLRNKTGTENVMHYTIIKVFN